VVVFSKSGQASASFDNTMPKVAEQLHWSITPLSVSARILDQSYEQSDSMAAMTHSSFQHVLSSFLVL
jgi:hypothetical protein